MAGSFQATANYEHVFHFREINYGNISVRIFFLYLSKDNEESKYYACWKISFSRS